MFSGAASPKGASITGIDASGLIERAKKRYPSVKFMIGEIEELSFADNTIDLAGGGIQKKWKINFRNLIFLTNGL